MDREIEKRVVNAFMVKRRRDRAFFELADEEMRGDFLWYMLDRETFDPTYMQRILKPVSSPRIIHEILQKQGAPDTCYVMKEHSPYDGQIVPLAQGVADLVFMGPGLISCIHGRLAYLEGEPGAPGPGRRFLLIKK